MSRASGINNTGRSKPGPRNRRTLKFNRPPKGERFVWETEEMLCSPAFRVLSLNARRVLDRLRLEHMAHCGAMNGKLICPYGDLERWGVRRNKIRKALEELISLGVVVQTYHGGKSSGAARNASRYWLAWLPDLEGRPAPNGWKRFKDLEQARAAVSKPLKADRLRKIHDAAERRALKLAASQDLDSQIDLAA